MTVMATSTDVLEPGTLVKCQTCYDVEISGEVAAFDFHKKALILVTQPQAGSSQKNNTVHMLNLNNLKSLTVEKEPSGEKEAPLPSLDNAKLTQRVRQTVAEKALRVSSIGIGVTPEAQSLFNLIKKTLDDVKWDGKNIVVLGDVRITEPYSVKDLYTLDGRPPQTLDHVSKIVQRFHADK